MYTGGSWIGLGILRLFRYHPKIGLAVAVLFFGTVLQLAFGFLPYLPGAWTGISGRIAPADAVFDQITVASANPDLLPQIVPVNRDGSFRLELLPGTYSVWIAPSSCTNIRASSGGHFTLTAWQHIDIASPPYLAC